MELAD